MVQSASDSQAKELINDPVAPPGTARAKNSAKTNTGSGLLWLALLLVCGASLAASFFFYQQLVLQQQHIAALDLDAQQFSVEQKNLDRKLQDNLTLLHEVEVNSQAQIETFTKKIETQLASQAKSLAQMNANSRIQFLLNEAQFLVRQANQRLQLERSTEGAIRLFVLADQILAQLTPELGNPVGLLSARKQLAEDLSVLRSIPSVDYSGIYFAIEGVIYQLDNAVLAIPPRTFEKRKLRPSQLAKAEKSWWTKLSYAWREFTREVASFIRVRRQDNPAEPLLPPEQERNLRDNIKLKLHLAEWSLLRSDTDMYVNNLVRASEWMAEFFPAGQARDQLVEQINLLAQESVHIDLPDVSTTIRALEAYRNQYLGELEVKE